MPRIVMALLVVALAGAAAATAVHAASSDSTPTTHYRWKDASGVVHYSDTIPSSALARGYDIVNAQGMVVRHVQRELTPEEKRVAAATAAKEAAARRQAQQQKLEDAQLLAAYPTDTQLEASQQAQLDQIRNDIASLQTNLRSQEDSLAELLAHAADLEHNDQPIPPHITKRIADQRTTVNNERNALNGRRTDLAQAKSKFQAQLQRYRELRAQYDKTDDATP